MNLSPRSARIREFFLRLLFFLFGAYPAGTLLWDGTVTPALAAPEDFTLEALVKIAIVFSLTAAIGGALGLLVLGFLHIIWRKMTGKQPPHNRSSKLSSEQKKRMHRHQFVILLVAFGIVAAIVILPPRLWWEIPGATVRVDNEVFDHSIYTSFNGQWLIALPGDKKTAFYIIDLHNSATKEPRICSRGDDLPIYWNDFVHIDNANDLPCEALPAADMPLNPHLTVQKNEIRFTSPDDMTVEISFEHQ